MFKKVRRKPENSRCWRCFVNRVRYIIDQTHPHHKIKKVVQAAINFGCLWGQTAMDFIQSVHESLELWEIRNKNGKGGGNPTKDVFFELVYSAPAGLRTTAEERDAIDTMITSPFRNCPIRRNWHLAAWDLEEAERPENWKPLDDVHYLISARDAFGNATISSRFGDGRETLESWMRRMDEVICDMLNQTREKQYEPVHPIYLRGLEKKLKVKLTKLHEMIAHHTSKPVHSDNLVSIIEDMERPAVDEPNKMVSVAKVTKPSRILEDDRWIWVHFTGRKEPNKFRIKKLLLQIAETQLDIELARPDGNDGEEGGAGGESGGGTGGLGGVCEVVSANDPTQSTPKSAAVKPEPTPATPGPIPALPGSMPPSTAESVPTGDESAKPQDASLSPAHVVGPARQPEPIPASSRREKSRQHQKPQPSQEDEEQEMS